MRTRSCKFDQLDLRIIKALSEDCRKSITQVAKETGISRPTAIARINTLAQRNLLDFSAKVNLNEMGLKLATLTLEIETVEEE